MKNLLFVILTMLACGLYTGAWAQDVVVTNGNDSGMGSLRQAVLNVGDGKTITFSGVSTVVLTSGEIAIDKNVTINGGNGVTIKVQTTYAESTTTASKFRVFNVGANLTKDDNITVNFTHLDLRGGNISAHDIYNADPNGYGGVILVCSGCNLTLDEVSVSEAYALYAGGIFNKGTLTVTNSTISGNRASNYGGGIYNWGILMTIINSTISENRANYGGGGISNEGMSTIIHSTISGNQASIYSGGGIFDYSGTVTLLNSIVLGNKDRANDGDIWIYLKTDDDDIDDANIDAAYSIYGMISAAKYGDISSKPTLRGSTGNITVGSPGIVSVDALIQSVFDNNVFNRTTISISGTGVAATKGTLIGSIGTQYYFRHKDGTDDKWYYFNAGTATAGPSFNTIAPTYGLTGGTVIINSQNGISRVVTHNAYSVGAYGYDFSTDASLSNLTINQGVLDPTFDTNEDTYSVTVGNAIENITITTTSIVTGAIVSGDGPQTLVVGANSFPIVVTAEDGVTTKTYTVNVIRRAKVSLNNLDINITSKTYDGLPAAAATVATKQTTTGLGMISNIKYGNSSTPPTNAGTYSVTADIDEGTYYDAVSNFPLGDLIISKAIPTSAELSYVPISATYDGTEKPVTVSPASGATGLGAISNIKYNGDATLPISAGTYAITADIAEGLNYEAVTGLVLSDFTINKATPASNMLSYNLTSQVYDGSAKSVTVDVASGITGLGTITIKYNGSTTLPINTGLYTVTVDIAQSSNYNAVSLSLGDFSIAQKFIDDASVTVSEIPSQTYTGAAFTPQPEVKDGTTVLVKDRDYTLSYSNNVNVGTATVTITGKGNYGSSRTETFTINRAAAVAPAPASLPEGLEATYGDRFSSVTLPAGFRWPSPSSTVGNASSYPVTVLALYNPNPQNYEDYEVNLSLIIHQAQPFAQVVFPEAAPQAGTAALVYDPDRILSNIGLANGTGPGTFSWRYPNSVPTVNQTEYEIAFTPTDANNYDYSNVPGWNPQTRTIIRTVTLTIIPEDIQVMVEANPTYIYTGLPVTVTATVTISSLRSSREVTPALEYLFYRNGQLQDEAVNAGQYEVIARSADVNYRGESAPVSFTIEKAQPVILVNDTVANYTGNPVSIAYELTGSHTASGLSRTLKFTYEGMNGTAYSLTEKEPVEIGEYTVHISTPGSVNHLPAEAEISLKIVSGTTDLKDLKDFKDFKIYPNPAGKNSKLFLESGQWTMDNGELWVEVYNTGGNMLRHIPITKKQTELRSESAEGIYLYVVKSKAGVLETMKIVVK